MLPTLFALTTQTRADTNPPTQIYAAVPMVQASEGPAPRLQIHGATVYLGINESKVETITLWHNDSDKLVKGKVILEVSANGYGFSGLKNLKSTFNKAPVAFTVESVDKSKSNRESRFRPSQVITAVLPYELPAKGTGSLTMEWLQPTAKTGMNKDARQFVYQLKSLSERPEQLRLALKFTPDVVWKPLAQTSPIGKWETGTHGAYLKLDGLQQRDGFALFSFYPPAN